MNIPIQLRLESLLAECLTQAPQVIVKMRRLVKRVQRFANIQFELLFPEKKHERLEEKYLREIEPGKYRWETRAVKSSLQPKKQGKRRGSPCAMRKIIKDEPYSRGL